MGTLRTAALHYMRYDFVRIHKTLGMTPATAAGVIVNLIPVPVAKKRGPYKKRKGR